MMHERPPQAVTICDTKRGKWWEIGVTTGKGLSLIISYLHENLPFYDMTKSASQAYDEGSIPFTRSRFSEVCGKM
jgi:hypothetical protein